MKTILRNTLATLAVAGFASVSHAQLFTATLNGSSEAVPNASSGFGSAFVTLDSIANTMRVQVTFANLTAGTAASHIHAATAAPFTGTAGVATQLPTFTGFPLGVTSGAYDQTFDMTLAASYNPAFVTANGGTTAAAQAALFSAIGNGQAYLNIHTTAFPSGEIRGFFRPVSNAVPEPGEWAAMGVLGAGLGGLVLRARRRRAA